MKPYHSIVLALYFTLFSSCESSEINTEQINYFDKPSSDTIPKDTLIAHTDEEFLQYGVRVAYLNMNGDTIIPYGKFAYLGTDTLIHYANVVEKTNKGNFGKWIAIEQNQNVLYEIYQFDNGPDYFEEGLVRARRNNKMGFSNEYGHIVIPCIYDFVWPFKNGKAKVTFNARFVKDKSIEHIRVLSDEWFYIDKNGQKIK